MIEYTGDMMDIIKFDEPAQNPSASASTVPPIVKRDDKRQSNRDEEESKE